MSDYIPIIKKKNFLPNPIAVNGIPLYADSSKNPKVVGTSAWEDWWNEQIYYCLNGYTTGGMYIPGRYYYYLNFCMMSTVGKGNHQPAFVDLDYQFFKLVDEVKKEKKGIISLKARRRGLSYKVAQGVIDYGFRFKKSYKAGICAGLKAHADDFFEKFKDSQSMKPHELRMSISFGDEGASHRYRVKENGIWLEKGTFNTLYVSTMFQNPGAFKGKRLEDCVFEEAGEFPLLIEGFEATKPCFMDGDRMTGTPFIYGTGGNMKKGSAAFSEMWHEPESFNLVKFWVPANRLQIPYIAGIKGSPVDPQGEEIEDIPNLLNYKPYERFGMEDIERAKDQLAKDRDIKSKKKNKKSFYEHLQNYPLTEKEAFLRFSGNDFPTEEINNKLFEIDSEAPKYTAYELSWSLDKDGSMKTPMEVEANILSDEELAEAKHNDTGNIVYVYKLPVKQYRGLDIAGLDSYDLDKSQVSKSLGAMVVYRREHSIPNLEMKLPVALVNYRPKRKEIFYDTCAMVAVWYNLQNNVLIDVDKALVIKHFEDLGLSSYLAPRPRKFESPDSKQRHDYGVKLTTYSKPLMVALLQSYFSMNAHKVEFDQILNEALDYEVIQKESDWDTIDAFGIALMRDADMYGKPYDEDEEQKDKSFELSPWKEDANGNLIREDQMGQGKSIDDYFV